jgi:myo-inositol 2-dehydrogenase/D-chiro-inositol 1-dehydrogenase
VSGGVAVAVVGAGRMGRVHLRALERTRLARPAAVVEPVAGVRTALGRDGLPVHESIEGLVAAGGVDGVVITAPTDLHLGLVRRCAEAGLHVFCEKPCGLDSGEARAAAAAAEAAGVVLQVGYYRRFVPALGTLRTRIASGGFGDVSLVALHQWDEHPPSPEFERRSGGIVVDMGVHELDQLRWMTGQEIDDVRTVASAAGGGSAVLAIGMSGGTLAVVTLGRRFPEPDSCWCEVVGTAAYERVPFVWGADGAAVTLAAVAAELDAFADAVTGGERTGAGGGDAVAALEAAECAAG